MRKRPTPATLAMLIALWLPSPPSAADPQPPPIEATPDRTDLRRGPLPGDEPERADALLSCELADEQLCAVLRDHTMELGFAWHRAGYTVRLRDGADAPTLDDGGRITGRARRRDRVIELFIHWSDTVIDPAGAFRGVERTLAHELGHAMHQTCGDGTLERWRQARRIPADVPTHGHGYEGETFNSVAEDFADAAMGWLTDGRFQARSPLAAGTAARYPGDPAAVSSAPALPDPEAYFIVCR